MRRCLGALTLAVSASLLLTSTASAQNSEGRVVNAKPKRPVKRLVDPAPTPTPAESTPVPAASVKEARIPESKTDAETTADLTTEPARLSEEAPVSGRIAESVGDATSDVEPAVDGEPTVVRTYENLDITEEEKRRAAAGQQAAAVEEQQMNSRVRGLQSLIAREEQLLAQRLAYANKLREKGLASNDEKTLKQAEQFERAALVEYQKKVEQFERANVMSVAPVQPRRGAAQPPRTSKNPTPSRR